MTIEGARFSIVLSTVPADNNWHNRPLAYLFDFSMSLEKI